MKLKKEGKEDEMERLFADALANDKGMIDILGMSKEQYLKSLEEKFAILINLAKLLTFFILIAPRFFRAHSFNVYMQFSKIIYP